jgi:hypothetical protein
MTAIGVDVAQGGDDMTVDAARQGGWYARLFRKPGKETREGSDIARMVVGVRHDNCPVIVDVGGGWGAAALGPLECNVLVQCQSFAEIRWRDRSSMRTP